MSVQPVDVRRVILDEDDFGHEMRVGHILSELANQRAKDSFNGTDVEPPDHGGTYTDSVTGKPRQFDYRCRIVRQEPSNRATCALLAIECKNLHLSAPLVVCGRPRTTAESFYVYIESIYYEHTTATAIMMKSVIPGQQFYRPGEFVGKSLVRLKEKNGVLATDTNADIYDRWSQALASSVELAERACSFANSRNKNFCSLVLPIVVVPNGTLWTATYDDSGAIPQDPCAVDTCEFFVERRISVKGHPFALTHVHFATLRGLPTLLSRFWHHHSAWNWIFPADSQVISSH